MEIKPVAAFADNYIWLIIAPDGRQTAIVDPGDAAPVFAALANHGLEPCAILATHHHADHVGGIVDLLARYPVPVYGPAAENIPGRTVALQDGDEVFLAALQARFRVLAVPGHTLGHIAYHGAGVLFAGDTLFMAGCGRLFEGTPAQMLGSLDRICALPDDTLIYCAHEYTQSNLRFALAVEPGNSEIRERAAACAKLRAAGKPTVPAPLRTEKETNPFLRVRTTPVQSAARIHAGRALGDAVSVFAQIREWKNNF